MNFGQKLGPKNTKEFADKVKTLDEEYKKAPANKKGAVLLEHLESIQSWSQDKQKDLKVSVFSKIGGVISSYTKDVISSISGDSKAASEHRLNASQTIKELTSGKKMSQDLAGVKTKTSSWAEKISVEKNSKEYSAGESR
ncbi:MAG: hypothetical protein H0U78_00150 [Rickettsiaceae bacterium]|nr:hypothetical protein [Rickettsiaceae bacterium]